MWRDVTLAAVFGATRESDILFLAISIPVFLITVTTASFRSAVVPALGSALATSPALWTTIARRFLLVASLVALVIAVLLGAVATLVYWSDLPAAAGPNRRLFALFLVAILPMYVASALVELIQGPLQVAGKFLAPSALRIGLPVGVVLGALLFPEQSVFSVALGGGAGALLALALGLGLLWQARFIPPISASALPPEVKRSVVTSYGALVTATCITYANPLVDQWVAGLAGEGSVSMLGYANRLTVGISALVAGALSQALLVHFGRLVSVGDTEGIQKSFRQLIRVAPWLGGFVTLGVWLTSDMGISLLYARGNFSAETSDRVSTLLDIYALQFPIYWTGITAVALVWAVSLNRVFIRIGIILFAVNAICDVVLLRLFGLDGLPVTTSIVFALSTILLTVALRKAGKIEISGGDLGGILVPFVLLGLFALGIRQYGIRLSPDATPSTLLLAAMMLVSFGTVSAVVGYRTIFKGGSVV